MRRARKRNKKLPSAWGIHTSTKLHKAHSHGAQPECLNNGGCCERTCWKMQGSSTESARIRAAMMLQSYDFDARLLIESCHV